jgi:peptidyl-prolyl cis-trans isomerase D
VRKEKKAGKIATDIKAKASSGQTLENLAAELNLPVRTAIGIRVTNPSLPEVGSEPAIAASALQLEKNTISQPLTGNNGVFVLVVTNVTAAAEVPKEILEREKLYIDRGYATRVNYTAFESLKNISRIKDNRRLFY